MTIINVSSQSTALVEAIALEDCNEVIVVKLTRENDDKRSSQVLDGEMTHRLFAWLNLDARA
jgi:hypothetical protein